MLPESWRSALQSLLPAPPPPVGTPWAATCLRGMLEAQATIPGLARCAEGRGCMHMPLTVSIQRCGS